jgi:hypothetical protein
MADNTKAQWSAFLYEMQGKVVQVFPTEAPLLAELSGVGDPQHVGRITPSNAGREVFSGKNVRHTIVLAQLPAGGWVTETQTWNRPQALASQQVNIVLCDMVQPFNLSVDLERDTFDNSGAAAVEELTDQARTALARTENYTFLGDGTGKVSDIVSGTSPGLSINVSLTGTANMDILLPGTVWDVATKSTAVPTTGGKRRRIASVVDSTTTQTVVFDTAAQASDGDSGNITFSTLEGIFIPGSATTPALAGTLAAQGIEQVAAVTGVFETLDKATTQQWQGTDGRNGDTTTVALSDQMFQAAVRRGRRAAVGVWDFAIGDPAAIDLYTSGKFAQVRYDPQFGQIKSGFPGIIVDVADKPFPCIKEPSAQKGKVKLIVKNHLVLYGDKPGPSLLDDDGAVYRRFSPTLLKEADMLDRVQLGAKICNSMVFLNNLAVAT